MADFLTFQAPKESNQKGTLSLDISHEGCIAISRNFEKLDEHAKMTTDNWEVFLTYYIEKRHKNVNLETFIFKNTATQCRLLAVENGDASNLDMLFYMLSPVFEKPEKFYDFLKEESKNIPWK